MHRDNGGSTQGGGAQAVQLPYEVARAWPADWDLLPGLRGETDRPLPGDAPRYLHDALEVRAFPGRGRGVVALRDVEAGALLCLDSPLLTAGSYDELVSRLTERTLEDKTFRRQVLSMCGDPSDEAARANVDSPPSPPLLRNIVRHNYHGVEAPPVDGELPSGRPAVVGLWPLASLINHSLRPNLTRTFVGHCICARSIRSIKAGEEVLDNYLDLRLPAAMRQDLLRKNHGISDEGPDDCDGPADAVAEARDAHTSILERFDLAKRKASQAAFKELAELTNRCDDLGVSDPSLAEVFKDFGIVAGRLGDVDLALQGLARAVELATARERYSVISCVLALRMLHVACLAGGDVDGALRGGLEAVARKHFRMVYGEWPGAFEAMNPQLAQRLAARGPGPGLEGAAAKRPRAE